METAADEAARAAPPLVETEGNAPGAAVEESAVGGGGSGAGSGSSGKRLMKVLMAVDESQGSLYALSWALDNLFACSAAADVDGVGAAEQVGCRLILLHAQQQLHHFIQPVGPAVFAMAGVFESVKKAQEENSRILLEKAMKICKRSLVDAELVIVEGDPKEMICRVAEQMQVDLLVIGSRGLGIIKRAILGSVSDYCAHHAKCPILIVKPPRDKK